MLPRLGDRIELEFPVQPQMFFLARLTAAAIASHAKFERDQIEDLRLAVDELLLALTRATGGDNTAGSSIHLDFQWHVDVMEVVASVIGGDEAKRVAPDASTRVSEENVEHGFSDSILSAVVDEHAVPRPGEPPRAWLRIRRRAALN